LIPSTAAARSATCLLIILANASPRAEIRVPLTCGALIGLQVHFQTMGPTGIESTSLWSSLPLGPARPRGQECFCVAPPRAQLLRPARSFATSATLRARLTADPAFGLLKAGRSTLRRTTNHHARAARWHVTNAAPGARRVEHERKDRPPTGSATRGRRYRDSRQCGWQHVLVATAPGLRGGSTNKPQTSGPVPPP